MIEGSSVEGVGRGGYVLNEYSSSNSSPTPIDLIITSTGKRNERKRNEMETSTILIDVF